MTTQFEEGSTPPELAQALKERDTARVQLRNVLVEQAASRILGDLDPTDEWRDMIHTQVLMHLDAAISEDGEMSLAVVEPETGNQMFSASGEMTTDQLAQQVLKPKFARCLNGSKEEPKAGDDWRNQQPVTIKESEAQDFQVCERARSEARERGVELQIVRGD